MCTVNTHVGYILCIVNRLLVVIYCVYCKHCLICCQDSVVKKNKDIVNFNWVIHVMNTVEQLRKEGGRREEGRERRGRERRGRERKGRGRSGREWKGRERRGKRETHNVRRESCELASSWRQCWLKTNIKLSKLVGLGTWNTEREMKTRNKAIMRGF